MRVDEIRVTDVGKKIRLIRMALGIRLQALAKAADISALHLSRIEKEMRDGGEKALSRIAEELGIDLEDLMNSDLVFRMEEEGL